MASLPLSIPNSREPRMTFEAKLERANVVAAEEIRKSYRRSAVPLRVEEHPTLDEVPDAKPEEADQEDYLKFSTPQRHPNPYVNLVSAGKSRRSEIDVEASRLLASQNTFPDSKGFAPAKKPITRNNVEYDNIVMINTRTTRYSSDWYENESTKGKINRADLASLKYIQDLIDDCKAQNSEAAFEKLRVRLHKAEFYDFLSRKVVKKSKLLEDTGLSAIFEDEGDVFPWDLRADSLALHQIWLAGRLDPDLLRGIQSKTKTTAGGKEIKTRNLDPNYRARVSCNYVGQGRLQNGDWFPFQICAVRDGCHGEIEAGIHGKKGRGAFSIVLSSGGYADVDDGDTIRYCGTAGKEEEPSTGTLLLKQSLDLKIPVRVLRSAALPATNRYRPTKGIRFDGLYVVESYVIKDKATAMHQFLLKRRAEQFPIRYQGIERRPTNEQLLEYAAIRHKHGLDQ